MKILDKLSQTKRDFCEWLHVRRHRKTLPERIAAMRAKEKVKVLFVLWDLPMWKTESLYKAMLEHPRFEPILGLTLNLENTPSESINKYNVLSAYLKKNSFAYVDLTWRIMNNIDADLIFYEKPYDNSIDRRMEYSCFTHKLICHSNYAFNSIDMPWCFDIIPLYKFSAFYFVENNKNSEYTCRRLPVITSSVKVTGLPFMDGLLRPKEAFLNPWKECSNNKKRIIWAPHFSIPQVLGYLNYSCFLDVCDIMVELAEKYRNVVHFAFKPHPLLKTKLEEVWGKEKTNDYYSKWETMENTQYEKGEYNGLFKYSDAMIHDCSSFTMEYHYTLNPVMYLVNGKPHTEEMNDFAKGAYNCHYFGHNREEIENFIQNVIDGVDPMKEQRRKYFEENLLPPNGKTSCENIIDAILGQNGYN